MPFRFLNVDLEIRSRSSLDSVARAMGNKVSVLYLGTVSPRQFLLSVETAKNCKAADRAIHDLCSIVESLPDFEKGIWNKSKKVFDIGYDFDSDAPGSGNGEKEKRMPNAISLRNDTLKRMADLGSTMTITLYKNENRLSTRTRRNA